ncbi:uncharacterized protein Z519_06541 [Cladophialophora bantiana CBS 173.52]|uniref:Uncharacterized protein n=1 Tax=Cladophialophora bantiana (strain ATCC 10958 / CBS 173.52 / CDC B-1940 / NIH 8579) TaxID=1442370 RepID=A0A0D2I777_CLAB1|nr:uncharacterized protein Z519_06541 [Cladophialophora bantiana CBS 173.52]KIW92694.1 hypothetical protein Z519_06541 [Cladophialophora bantiana CBS 173.52]
MQIAPPSYPTSMTQQPTESYKAYTEFPSDVVEENGQQSRKSLIRVGDLLNIDVQELILQWAHQDIPKITKAYPLKGGWEGRAQVEIAILIGNYYAQAAATVLGPTTTVTLSREVAFYESSPPQRADIVVTTSDGPRDDYVIIELKCEGAFNTPNFTQGVTTDVKKIEAGIKPAFWLAKRFAHAITTSEEGYQQMQNAGYTRNDQVLLSVPGGVRRLYCGRSRPNCMMRLRWN